MIVSEYEPKPIGRKSFYGKAVVKVEDNGTETLYSYDTPVLRKLSDGTYQRLWNDWSATTGRHVIAFSGISKAEWNKMEVVK